MTCFDKCYISPKTFKCVWSLESCWSIKKERKNIIVESIKITQNEILNVWNSFLKTKIQDEDQGKVVDGQQRPMETDF